jgi:hypothetical protein
VQDGQLTAAVARSLARCSADSGSPESQLTAADVHLSDDVLEQIDAIVSPGVTLNPADNGWVSPALEPAARRR